MIAFKKEWFNEPVYSEEGFIPYTCQGHTYRLWFGRVGKGHKPQLLVLHGGPGGSHHNLIPLQALSDQRPVIFYDQLGCGNSDRPDDPSLWSAERYVDEVKAVKNHLDLKKYHLLGHSWGTTLAAAFAHRYSQGIISLALHSPVLSFPRYMKQVAPVLKAGLPGRSAKIIDDCELKGINCGTEYEKAITEFTRRYVIRTWPLPEPMNRLINNRNKQVHEIMVKSKSELNILGNLKKLDVSGFLRDFKMPVLFTAGQFDFCLPEFLEWHYSLANNAERYIIGNSAHMTLMDQPLKILCIQRNFMLKYDK
jgi:proline iminopeptidase